MRMSAPMLAMDAMSEVVVGSDSYAGRLGTHQASRADSLAEGETAASVRR
jgi:hypothetical protein